MVTVPEHPCPGCGVPRWNIAWDDEMPARTAAEIRIGTLLIARCCNVRIEVVADGMRVRHDLAEASWGQLSAMNRRLYGLAPEVAS